MSYSHNIPFIVSVEGLAFVVLLEAEPLKSSLSSDILSSRGPEAFLF